MRRLPSASPHLAGPEVGLPTGVEQLLIEVVADGFVVYCCGPKAAPNALIACYEWDDCLDLLTIRDFDRVTTARVPTQGRRVDIFAPKIVTWAYEGPPHRALRALLHLVHPAHPEAPHCRLPGAREPARSPRPATPDDDPTALIEPGRSAGCPAGHRDDDPRW